MAPKNLPRGAVERHRAAVVAACVTALTFCVGDAIAGQYPFGSRTRNVNDLGNQYVPFHAHLWDLLHGKADGGLMINWQSGYGTSFLPDLGTYLTSPFALLVGLFPRDRVDLAVFVITVLKTASAAAAMACLLLVLRPGRWWAAGLLGTSYALCGWTLMQASYNPMWLDGLIAFPLLCLVGEWARTGRRPILSVAVVALCWTANFYTAYMATLGAALVFVARLLTETDTDSDAAVGIGTGTDVGSAVRRKLSALGRASVSILLGIGLTAPILFTVIKGADLAYALPEQDFRPTPFADLLVRMLPGTYGFATPSTYVDTAALLLAFVLPFHPAVPRRTRIVWTALAVAVTVSLLWGPTHLLWHAFTTPNGSAYRQTFVMSGVLVIAAWLAVAHGLPDWRRIASGAALLAAVIGIGVIAADDGLTGPSTYPSFALGLLAAGGALLLMPRAGRVRGRLPAMIAVGLLFAVQVSQSAISDAWMDHKRLALFDDYPVWDQRQDSQRETIAAADGWPRYRTEPGREQTTGNDPLAVGGQGAQYYSSHTPDVWTRTLVALGGGWTSRGRSLQSLDNPVTDVLFSVGARLHSPPVAHRSGVLPQTSPPAVTRQTVPPLVTVHAPAAAAYGDSPYRNQELLLGSRVYTRGTIRLRDIEGRTVQAGPRSFAVNGSPTDWKHSTYILDASCPVGDQVFLWAPDFKGDATLVGAEPVRYVGRLITHRAAMQSLGTVPPGGRVSVRLRAIEPGTLDTGGIGCLDLGRLAAAERRLAAAAATSVHVTDGGISAQLPPGSRGFAVIAAPAINGWRCSVGGGASHPAQSYLGLLSVPLDGRATGVSCTFTPPGLRLGEAVCGASLLGVAAMAGYGWWRARRRPVQDGGDEPAAGQTAMALVGNRVP